MLIVGIIAVLLFGNRLPEVGRSFGRSIMEFKKGMREMQNEVDAAVNQAPPRSKSPARRTPPTTATSRRPLNSSRRRKNRSTPPTARFDTIPSFVASRTTCGELYFQDRP